MRVRQRVEERVALREQPRQGVNYLSSVEVVAECGIYGLLAGGDGRGEVLLAVPGLALAVGVAREEAEAAEDVLHLPLDLLGHVDRLVGVVHPLVPRLHQEHQPQLMRGVHLHGLADRDEVLQRLRHFEPLDVEVPGVPEVVHPLAPAQVRLRLRHFVVVVRELQVLTAGVNVEELTLDVGRHDRALDVPARAPGPPLAGPRRLPGLGLLPQGEVVGVFLLGVLRRQRALPLRHLGRADGRGGHQLPVRIPLLVEVVDAEVDAAGGVVRDPLLDELLDEVLDPAVHVVGDARDDVGPLDPERVHVREVRVLELPGVRVEDRVVRDGVAPLLVELGHERLAGGLDEPAPRAPRGRVHALLELFLLRELEQVLLGQFLVLLLVLFRRVRGRLLRLLRQQLLLGELNGGVDLLLQLGIVHRLRFLAEIVEQLVLPGSHDDLVVDVRDVDLVAQFVAEEVPHDPPDDVEGQVRARVAHVRDVVHGRPAHVPSDLLPLERDELLLLACETIEGAQPDVVAAHGQAPRWVPFPL
mmetsp:Transcript_99544/g.281681  ORF Transcript_99544/g.281681 Transcript_99544/m.281681 type:complete len:528 (+) Transcript_99544:947-2530(+)